MQRRRRAAWLCAWLIATAWLLGGETTRGGSDLGSSPRRPPSSRSENGDGSGAAVPFFDFQSGPLEARLFADAADRRLDEFRLIEAGLVASGVEQPDRLRHYRKRFDDLVEELKRSLDRKRAPGEQAAAVFAFLHRRVLCGGYQLESTDLRTALDEGRFNCVSASVLFCCLAEAGGLSACGLEMPGHAMARLRLPEQPLDVETTCRRWFELLDDPAGQAEATRRTLGADLSARYTRAREVSPVEMTAMIYYNRGVDLLAERRYDEAAVANAKALRLDPASTTARGNLLATVNNWAIALSAEGRYDEAAELLRDGMRFDHGFPAFSLNYVHVHHEWVQALCRAGQFEQAARLLEQAAAERPDLDYFRHSAREVHRRWGAASPAAGRSDEAGRLAGQR